jgi:hypothetical protein
VPLQPAVAELLTSLAPVLRRWGRWYLFGAQAVILHGFPRLSGDVDVTLEMMPEERTRFVQEMRDAGFDPVIDDPEFLHRTLVIPFLHRPTQMPLDLVLAGSGLEKDFLGRARPVDVAGTAVPLIDIEDLFIAKILAGRPKDMEDARALWRVRGRDVDAARIRGILRLLEEALSQSDLVPAFDSIARQ